ncbi:MAG: DNA polymerase III subunit delta [Flavobacteriales bacterium]|nr:DNA polymerase III subunit delta [Flavobacteriales bacterium]
MLFAEIPGNKIVKQKLIKSVQKQRIAHAQLFLGSLGNAKLPLAIAFAQYLNCEKRGEIDSCNSCHSCLMYNSLSHPDFHLIFPVMKINKIKNPVSDNFISQWREVVLENPYLSLTDWYQHLGAENKQAVIYKDEAEKLQKKVALKNYESAYRVILIWMPEKMNTVTANKLLKLIEEPPNGTFFLMVSEDFEKLLPTITSRMQIVKTKAFSIEEITLFLKTKKGVEKEKAQKISAIANGNINKAITLSQNETEENTWLNDFQKWMQICYKINLSELVNWTDNISKIGRENQKEFLQYALKIIRACLIANTNNQNILKLQKEEENFVSNFTPFIHGENSISISNRLEKTIYAVERNANPKILFYELSLQMMRLLKVKRKLAN